MTQKATVFTLYGATGDLAKRMVLPALWELHAKGLLPEQWRLVGNGRGNDTLDDFVGLIQASLREFGPGEVPKRKWHDFASRLRFAGGGFTAGEPGSLLDVVTEAHRELGEDTDYVHYLAIPPGAFGEITQALAAHQLLGPNARVVYEKPYGTNLQAFRELDELVHSVMDEEQVYRIDHFLGKEATRNLQVLRLANSMIGNIWSAQHIQQVQIDAPETLNVADRAEFYDATGAYRDMVATHLFQVAAEVAMEPPASMAAEDLQVARADVLSRFRPLDPRDVVLGQFDGYRDLTGVAPNSTTDTFAAIRLWVDSPRWGGVPFVLRSGKRMHRNLETVSLLLRQPTGPLTNVPRSVLRLSLAGTGSIQARLVLKQPGPELGLEVKQFDLQLNREGLEPYVALIKDVLDGDRSLFISGPSMEHAWQAAQPILDAPPTPVGYAPGSWGPAEAEQLTDGQGWLSQLGS